ncbi:MAG: phosphotransferase [Halioglobus sp.]
MSHLPVTPQEITSDWLSDVLGESIRSVTLLDAHTGTTGRAVIEIDHDSERLPKRLFVKLPPTDEMQRHFVVSTGMGRNEVQFYKHLSDELPVCVPHAYFADASEDATQYIMLLEHLEDRGCTFRNARNRYGEAYLKEVLAVFARMHGAYWNSERFETDLQWVTPPGRHEIAVPLIEKALARHGEDMPPVFSEMANLYIEQTDAVHNLWQTGTPTLIHGDVHDGNFYYDSDQPGLLDWAIVSRGPAMRDVAYFLTGSLRSEHQAWAKPLVEYYLQELSKHCTDAPSFDEIWQQFQWHAAYVWVGSTVTLAMGEEWQPVKYVLAGLKQIHVSMESLGSVNAIRNALTKAS